MFTCRRDPIIAARGGCALAIGSELAPSMPSSGFGDDLYFAFPRAGRRRFVQDAPANLRMSSCSSYFSARAREKTPRVVQK